MSASGWGEGRAQQTPVSDTACPVVVLVLCINSLAASGLCRSTQVLVP